MKNRENSGNFKIQVYGKKYFLNIFQGVFFLHCTAQNLCSGCLLLCWRSSADLNNQTGMLTVVFTFAETFKRAFRIFQLLNALISRGSPEAERNQGKIRENYIGNLVSMLSDIVIGVQWNELLTHLCICICLYIYIYIYTVNPFVIHPYEKWIVSCRHPHSCQTIGLLLISNRPITCLLPDQAALIMFCITEVLDACVNTLINAAF